MKKKTQKIGAIMTILTIVIMMNAINVSAQSWHWFDGWIGGNHATEVCGPVLKENTNKYSMVDWRKAEVKNKPVSFHCYFWFKNGTIVKGGKVLNSERYTDKRLTTNLTPNAKYRTLAERENLVDPASYITGYSYV